MTRIEHVALPAAEYASLWQACREHTAKRGVTKYAGEPDGREIVLTTKLGTFEPAVYSREVVE